MPSIRKRGGARIEVTSGSGKLAENARLVHALTANSVFLALVVLILTARGVPTLASCSPTEESSPQVP